MHLMIHAACFGVIAMACGLKQMNVAIVMGQTGVNIKHNSPAARNYQYGKA